MSKAMLFVSGMVLPTWAAGASDNGPGWRRKSIGFLVPLLLAVGSSLSHRV